MLGIIARVDRRRRADAGAAGSSIIAGLTLCAACGLLCQAISTGYVTITAKEGRSSAVGLYVSSFYVGGSVGAFLTGFAWDAAAGPACVAMVIPGDAADHGGNRLLRVGAVRE